MCKTQSGWSTQLSPRKLKRHIVPYFMSPAFVEMANHKATNKLCLLDLSQQTGCTFLLQAISHNTQNTENTGWPWKRVLAAHPRPENAHSLHGRETNARCSTVLPMRVFALLRHLHTLSISQYHGPWHMNAHSLHTLSIS